MYMYSAGFFHGIVASHAGSDCCSEEIQVIADWRIPFLSLCSSNRRWYKYCQRWDVRPYLQLRDCERVFPEWGEQRGWCSQLGGFVQDTISCTFIGHHVLGISWQQSRHYQFALSVTKFGKDFHLILACTALCWICSVSSKTWDWVNSLKSFCHSTFFCQLSWINMVYWLRRQDRYSFIIWCACRWADWQKHLICRAGKYLADYLWNLCHSVLRMAFWQRLQSHADPSYKCTIASNYSSFTLITMKKSEGKCWQIHFLSFVLPCGAYCSNRILFCLVPLIEIAVSLRPCFMGTGPMTVCTRSFCVAR